MLPSLNKNSNQPPILEDIFAAVNPVGPAAPAPVRPQPAAPVMPPTENTAVAPVSARPRWRRPVFIIGGGIILVLIIVGIFIFIFRDNLFGLSSQPVVNKNIPVINSSVVNKPNLNAAQNQDRTDTDRDGLTDQSEINVYKTDPQALDTDGDGLTDREEVKVYLTDPNQPDTDGDGYTDGDEVANFFNPLGPGKLFDLNAALNSTNQ